MCQDFASEFKINVWLRQGGYLFLARTEERRRALEESCKLQRECGLSTRMLSPREAQKIVPELSTDGVVAASYNPDDGVVFPWPFVWGFAQAATKLGVEIATFTEVIGFDTRGARIEGVRVRRAKRGRRGPARGEHTIRTNKVVNACRRVVPGDRAAASASSCRTSRTATRSARPSRSSRGSSRSSPISTNGLYFTQSTRGEIVGGIGAGARPRGPRPGQLVRVPRALRARARRDVPRPRQGEGAAPVVRLLRPHARREPHRRRRRRRRALLPSVRLHGPRLHDGAGRSASSSPSTSRRRRRTCRCSSAGTCAASRRASCSARR